MINAIPSIFYINFGKIRRMDVFGILDKEVDVQDFSLTGYQVLGIVYLDQLSDLIMIYNLSKNLNI